MEDILRQLAVLNYSGAPFLAAYGLTWMLCGAAWKKLSPPHAALATLFQGMAALPVALLLMSLIGAFENRPDTGILNSLVIIVAMSQLLALPLLIAMYRKHHFTLIPFVFSTVGAVHFLPYSWLYQTPSFIIMSALISFALSFLYAARPSDEAVSPTEASQACFLTGTLLVLNGIYLVATQLMTAA